MQYLRNDLYGHTVITRILRGDERTLFRRDLMDRRARRLSRPKHQSVSHLGVYRHAHLGHTVVESAHVYRLA